MTRGTESFIAQGASRRHLRTNRLRLAAALTASLSLVAVGCGGDDDDTTSETLPAGSEATGDTPVTASATEQTEAPGASVGAAPEGEPIKIGQIATQQSPTYAASTIGRDVLEMWAETVNATGGIGGRPVEVISIDDKQDPASGLTAARQLIEQDEVVALVGNVASGSEQAWQDLATDNGVPVIGGIAWNASYLERPNFYAVGPVITALLYGNLYGVKEIAGVDTAALLICNNSATCEGAVPLYEGLAPGLGLDLVDIVPAAVDAANFTSECIRMKDAGAQAIIVAGMPLEKVALDCGRQGFDPQLFTIEQFGVNSQLADEVNLVTATSGFPNFEPYPETQAYFDALATHHPEYLEGGDKHDLYLQGGPGGSIGPLTWMSAEAFKKAVENASVAPDAAVTRSDVTAGLSMFAEETLGGLTPPMTFGDGTEPNPPTSCFFIITVAGGKFDAPNGMQTSCMPPDALG